MLAIDMKPFPRDVPGRSRPWPARPLVAHLLRCALTRGVGPLACSGPSFMQTCAALGTVAPVSSPMFVRLCVLYGMRDALWCLFSMEAGERELSVCSLA